MILGVLSDTHGISGNVLAHIALEFQARNVEIVIHAGDISESDIQQMKILFGNLPVICALTDEQVAHFNKQHHEGKEIPIAPGKSWTFTQPGKRIVPLANGVNVYVGHKRGFRFLYGSIEKLIENLILVKIKE